MIPRENKSNSYAKFGRQTEYYVALKSFTQAILILGSGTLLSLIKRG